MTSASAASVRTTYKVADSTGEEEASATRDCTLVEQSLGIAQKAGPMDQRQYPSLLPRSSGMA